MIVVSGGWWITDDIDVDDVDDVNDDSSCDSGGRVLISYRQLNDVPALERADKGLALLRLQAYASLLLVLYLRQQISSAAQMCVLCVFSLMHVLLSEIAHWAFQGSWGKEAQAICILDHHQADLQMAHCWYLLMLLTIRGLARSPWWVAVDADALV